MEPNITKKHTEKKKDKNDIIAGVIIGLFFIVNLVLLFGFYAPGWDESVYIHISEYIKTTGNSGFLENLRPVLMSVLLIPFSSLFTMRLFVLILSVLTLWFIYEIAKRWMVYPYLFPLFVLLYEGYFIISTSILTEIPAIFFHVLSIYFFLSKKYFRSGVFAGLSFFIRFNSGIFWITGIIGIIIIEYHGFRKKPIQELITRISRYSLGILATFSLLIINILLFYKEADGLLRAAFFPIINQFNDSISSPYLWFYRGDYLFYINLLFSWSFFSLFVLLGVFYAIYLIIKKQKRELSFFLLQMIIPLAYLSFSARKYDRYVLLALVWIIFFMCLGIDCFLEWINKKINRLSRIGVFWQNKKHKLRNNSISLLSFIIILIIVSTLVYSCYAGVKSEYRFPKEFYERYFYYLENQSDDKTVLVSAPMVKTHAKMTIGYYDDQYFFDQLNNTYDYIQYSPAWFPCKEDDSNCFNLRNNTKKLLDNDYVLLYNSSINGDIYYIYANQ